MRWQVEKIQVTDSSLRINLFKEKIEGKHHVSHILFKNARQLEDSF